MMHNRSRQRAATHDNRHEGPFSCVSDQRWSGVAAPERSRKGLSAFGTVFRFESVSKYESGCRQVTSKAIRAGRPVPSSTQVTYRMTGRIPGRMQSDECGALWTQFKASSLVRARMTPANGLHGLNPQTPDIVTRDGSVQPFRQGLRNCSGQSGGNDLLRNEWLPQGTLGLCREGAGCLSTLA